MCGWIRGRSTTATGRTAVDRRRLAPGCGGVVLVVSLGLVAATFSLSSGGGPASEVEVEIAAVRMVRIDSPVWRDDDPRGPVEAERATPHREVARLMAELERDCGLRLDAVCDAEVCAAGAALPRGDSVRDMVEITWRWPRVVGSRALVDGLGIPDASLPCTATFDDLTSGGPVLRRNHPGGKDLLCFAPPPPAANAATERSELAERFRRAGRLCDVLHDTDGFAEQARSVADRYERGPEAGGP